MPLVRYGGVWVDTVQHIRSANKWQQKASMDSGLNRWTWQYINGERVFVGEGGVNTLQYTNTGGANTTAHIMWSGGPDVANVQVYARIKTVAAGSNNRVYGVVVRGGGDATTKIGYIFRYVNGEVQLNRYSNAAITSVSGHPSLPSKVTLVNQQGNYLRMKMQIINDTMLGKAWLEGAAEPGWTVGAVNTLFTAPGHCGLFVGAGVDTYGVSAFQIAPL